MQPRVQIKSNARPLLIGVAVLAVIAVLLPNRNWTVILAALSGLILVSRRWMQLLADGLQVSRDVNARWVAVGDYLSETFTLTNNSGVPLLWAEVTDQSNVPGYHAASVRAASPRQTIRWREQAICERRGRFLLGPWSVRTSDPFGLFEVIIDIPETQEIVIHPPIHTALPVPLPSGFGSGELRSLQRREQALVNVSSLREYRPNDPLKHIHWRSVAKHGELLVRRFDEDSGGDVWILIDLFRPVQVGRGGDGTEEHAVLLAASLAAQALTVQRHVGLAAYGDEPQLLPPGYGEGQRWQILRSLALVSAETSPIPLAQALTDMQRLVKRGSALLVITADVSAEWLPNLFRLAQNGIGIHCALFDVESFRENDRVVTELDSPGPARQSAHAARRELNKLNISSTILQQGDLGRPTEPTTISNRDFVITPFGKAIMRGDSG